MFPVFFDAACTEQTVRLVCSSVTQGLGAEAGAVRRRRLRLISHTRCLQNNASPLSFSVSLLHPGRKRYPKPQMEFRAAPTCFCQRYRWTRSYGTSWVPSKTIRTSGQKNLEVTQHKKSQGHSVRKWLNDLICSPFAKQATKIYKKNILKIW